MPWTEFAKGPWTVESAEFGEGEEEGCIKYAVRMPDPVISVREGKLIEAALDMYAALANLCSGGSDGRAKDWDRAEAALRKARGEAQ